MLDFLFHFLLAALIIAVVVAVVVGIINHDGTIDDQYESDM